MRLKRVIELLIGLGVGLACLAPRLAPAQTPVVPGIYTTSNSNQVVGWAAISSTNPLPISGSFSATLSGFTPASVYATPLSVSNSSSRVALPAGTVVAVYNTGSTAAYCQLGNSSVTATTSSDFVPGNSAIGFTVGNNVDIACITATGTTTVNLSGGSGLLTGFGGGGGGSSSNASVSATGSAVPASATYVGINSGGNLTGWNGAVTNAGTFATQVNGFTSWAGGTLGAMSNYGTSPGAVLVPSVNSIVPSVNTASVASWTTGTAQNTTAVIANSGNYPAIQISFSATTNVTAGAITFQGETADGNFNNNIPIAQILDPNTLATKTNPVTLTGSAQQFTIITQGYTAIQVKLTTAITTSSGAGTTVIAATAIPYNPVVSALLNPLTAGSAIIGKVGIDQTTPGTTNNVTAFNTNNANVGAHICGTAISKHITTNTDTQILAASASTTIYICDFEYELTGVGNFQLEKSSTGTCSSPTVIGQLWTGQTSQVTGKAAPNPFYRGFNTGASQQLCVNTAALSSTELDLTVYVDQY